MFLRKARQDLVAAEALAVTPGVSDEIVGFHCQQAAEKLLKAWLTQRARSFPRVRDRGLAERYGPSTSATGLELALRSLAKAGTPDFRPPTREP